jgi:hypothetical protein
MKPGDLRIWTTAINKRPIPFLLLERGTIGELGGVIEDGWKIVEEGGVTYVFARDVADHSETIE